MRIATQTLNQIGPTGIAQQQAELLRLSHIIATNRTVALAGDDPVAAAHAVTTKTALDVNTQYTASATPGAASSIATAPSSNAGSATIGMLSTTNASAATNTDAYTIAFQKDANGNTTYTVTDNTTGTTTQSASYTEGSAIALGGGQTLTINGKPENGDTFNVAPPTAAQSNVFATIDNLITALRTPSQSPSGHTNLANQMASGLQQLSNSYTTVLTTLASVGARQTELKSLKTDSSARDLAYSSQLSDLVGLTPDKMAGIYEQLVSVSTQLSATQSAYVKTQSLSLFSLIKT